MYRVLSAATPSVFTFGPAINYVEVNCATAFEKASLIPLAAPVACRTAKKSHRLWTHVLSYSRN
jgi:hypothetical protein